MEHFIISVTDIQVEDKKISPDKLIDILLENKIWYFNERARTAKKLNIGDDLLFYIAGIKKGFIYAKAKISSNARIIENKDEIIEGLNMFYEIDISDIEIFSKPVYIKPLVNELNFIHFKGNYGLYIRKSISRIPLEDYITIINKSR